MAGVWGWCGAAAPPDQRILDRGSEGPRHLHFSTSVPESNLTWGRNFYPELLFENIWFLYPLAVVILFIFSVTRASTLIGNGRPVVFSDYQFILNDLLLLSRKRTIIHSPRRIIVKSGRAAGVPSRTCYRRSLNFLTSEHSRFRNTVSPAFYRSSEGTLHHQYISGNMDGFPSVSGLGSLTPRHCLKKLCSSTPLSQACSSCCVRKRSLLSLLITCPKYRRTVWLSTLRVQITVPIKVLTFGINTREEVIMRAVAEENAPDQ